MELLNLTVVEAQAEVRRWQERAYQAEIQIRELELRLSEADRHAEAERFKVEQRALTAEMEVLRLQDHINAMYTSRSWRLSAPVRIGGEMIRKVGLSPSGVKRNVKLVVLHAAAYVRCRPVLKARISAVLSKFPVLRSRLVSLIGADALRGVVAEMDDEIDSVDRLTARGRKVHSDLTGTKVSNTP